MALGMFSEEPLEHCHKTIKDYEVNRTCQKSRYHRMDGIMSRLLCVSSPQMLEKIAQRQKHYAREAYPKGTYAIAQKPTISFKK